MSDFTIALLLTFAPLHLIAWYGIHAERKRLERMLKVALTKIHANGRF